MMLLICMSLLQNANGVAPFVRKMFIITHAWETENDFIVLFMKRDDKKLSSVGTLHSIYLPFIVFHFSDLFVILSAISL